MALNQSAIHLTITEPQKVAYQEGYEHWQGPKDGGPAGVLTVTVAEIVDFVERSLSQSP